MSATVNKGRMIEEMKAQCGQDPAHCFQCAKCSAACPVTAAMDLLPHQVIRYLQMGMVEELLKSKTPWICASCFTCAARTTQPVPSLLTGICKILLTMPVNGMQ